jgi:hypothetical protein
MLSLSTQIVSTLTNTIAYAIYMVGIGDEGFYAINGASDSYYNGAYGMDFQVNNVLMFYSL